MWGCHKQEVAVPDHWIDCVAAVCILFSDLGIPLHRY